MKPPATLKTTLTPKSRLPGAPTSPSARKKNAGEDASAPSEIRPKLRFPEFRGGRGWENKELNELLTIGSGRDYKHLSLGPIPVYGSGGYMLSVNEFLHEGDSVCIGRKGTIDNPIYLTGKFWTVDTLFYTHSFRDCIPKFIFNHFQLINWADHSEAGGIPSLSKTTIGRIRIPIPGIPEQQRIAACLSSLDDLIGAERRKLDTLKTHKKGLMQQLFPREGETRPQLRFSEFRKAREWEETCLGHCFDPIRNGFVGTATPFYATSEGVRYLQGRNIKEGRIGAENLIFITAEFHNAHRKSQLRSGDILMVQSGHVGECAVVGVDFAGCNCHALIILTSKRVVSPEFFVHYFYSPIGESAIFQITTGNTIKHILASELKTMSVFVPDLAEQRKIAACLSSLDDLIGAQTQKIEALKTHKKGLMQQLFPAPDEVGG